MAVRAITEQSFEQEVLLSEVPVLIEFSAEWCGPCKLVAPELAALSSELGQAAKVVTIDIDRSPNLARQLGVQSVPTFVVFNQGRPAGGKVGALKRNQLREMLEPYLPRAAGALKPEEVFQLVRAGAVSLIDTREPAVFGRAHIPGAKSVPAEEIEGRLAELFMLGSPPILYCRSGDRSREITAKLVEQELQVGFLDGGVLAWEAAGLPMERPD
jgi:thioredoxin